MDKVDKFLFGAGIKVSYKGFVLLKRIIELELDEPNIGLCDLMNQIAKENGTTFSRLERNVRCAIQKCDMNEEIAELFKNCKKIISNLYEAMCA